MLKFRDHTQTHNTRYDTGRVTGRRKFHYVTTNNIHKKEISMLPTGFNPAILASERPQTHTLDRSATGVDNCRYYSPYLKNVLETFLSAHRNVSYINTLFIACQNVLMKFKVPYYVHFPSDRLECEDFLYSFISLTSKFLTGSELTNENSTTSFCPLLSQ